MKEKGQPQHSLYSGPWPEARLWLVAPRRGRGGLQKANERWWKHLTTTWNRSAWFYLLGLILIWNLWHIGVSITLSFIAPHVLESRWKQGLFRRAATNERKLAICTSQGRSKQLMLKVNLRGQYCIAWHSPFVDFATWIQYTMTIYIYIYIHTSTIAYSTVSLQQDLQHISIMSHVALLFFNIIHMEDTIAGGTIMSSQWFGQKWINTEDHDQSRER